MPGCGDLVAEETGGGAEVEEDEIGIHGVAIFAELAGVTVGVADGEAHLEQPVVLGVALRIGVNHRGRFGTLGEEVFIHCAQPRLFHAPAHSSRNNRRLS